MRNIVDRIWKFFEKTHEKIENHSGTSRILSTVDLIPTPPFLANIDCRLNNGFKAKYQISRSMGNEPASMTFKLDGLISELLTLKIRKLHVLTLRALF